MKKRYINPTILYVEMQDNLMLDLSKIEAKGQTKDETSPKGGQTEANTPEEQQGLGAKSNNFSVWDD